MSDAKKQDLRHAKLGAKKTAARLAQGLLIQPIISKKIGTTVVQTNVSQTTRFPLPLTIGSAVIGAIGALAALRGHHFIGVGLLVVGGVGIGAAAAAPELQAELAKISGQSG